VELAVLVKAVPRSETVRYDPARRTVVREGAELVLNPFDQRALRVALELRRAGERVTVVSLGPASVGPLLREARAAGADRALHLCGSAFAGSDILATSAALASALRMLRPGLVVAGAWSTDSDTGLVGPEVAARLGLPVVTLARAIHRRESSSRVEVEVDTSEGWATVEVSLPAVITVGEKIAKPLTVTPEQFARTAQGSVEVVGLEELGLSAAEVGPFGSPTTVEEVREIAPTRLGRTFVGGPLDVRIRDALSTVTPLLRGPSSPPPPLPWPPAREADRELVVLCTGTRGDLDPASLGVLTHLRRALPAHTVAVAGYGSRLDDSQQERLEAAGALGGYRLDPGGARFDSGDVARGLSALLDHRPKLAAIVLLASPFGREVAGQFAASRSLGAVGDAIEVRAAPDGLLEWSKPSFGGRTLAKVRCRSRPAVATLPAGLALPVGDGRTDGAFAWTTLAPPAPEGRVVRRAEHVEPFDTPEADDAEVVVAVGTGVGGPEGIARLLPTVRRWGAALVATRRVVDAGWVPARRQVGLTGRFLAPRLALLLGVRGATNHMVGWARAGAVVAVNRDADAPVFRQADAGIVGTVEEVVPELAEPMERVLKARPPRA
jgi:electron transfer flavoprotein alpha subunit